MNVRALGKIDNLRKLARKDFEGQNLVDALNMLAALECLFGGGSFASKKKYLTSGEKAND